MFKVNNQRALQALLFDLIQSHMEETNIEGVSINTNAEMLIVSTEKETYEIGLRVVAIR